MGAGEQVVLGNGDRAVAFEPQSGPAAGAVVILHERYGLVQHTLDIARQLSERGYVGLAPDLFARWEGDHEALARGDVHATVTDQACAATLDTWIDWLKGHAGIDASRVAVMGVCQSGRYPIVVASRRHDIGAIVVLYGAAKDDDWETDENQPRTMREMIETVSAPGLYIFGERDHVISVDNVLRLRDTLEAAQKSYRMILVPGVPHGFLNDTMPGRYRPEETRQVWSRLTEFLGEAFGGGWAPGAIRWEFRAQLSPDYDFSANVRLE